MKRREERRKRERECIPSALAALVARVSPHDDPSAPLRYLETFATRQRIDDGDDGGGVLVLVGDGLARLCKELGDGTCSKDLLAVARRVPRSQSSADCIDVTELCFAIGQAIAPVNVHERRRNVGSAAPIDENAPLLKYYKGDRFATLLGSFATEDVDTEWKKFLDCLSSPLPMTLRVHQNEKMLRHVAQQFLQHDKDLCKVLQPVAPLLPSYSGLYGCAHAAYHADPRVEYICRTLHAANAVSFQEVVSVLPVLVAGIQPHHAVLDMCAAPGSKTLQVLDDMLKETWNTSTVSQGVVLVNEKDRVKATQVLPARLKRYHAPNTICMRCDAVQWPRLFSSSGEGEKTFTEHRFDRIICDVPCSGDGTLRKEPASASSWSPAYVKSLVPTQKALLRRGLDLLREGGILVYSTCSMNPKEDEEVVCAGLELFGDAVELLDVNAILKERGAVLHSAGGVLSPNVDQLRTAILPSTYDGRKLLRVLPHRDNTGGFFVAAFRKRSLPDWAPLPTLREKLNEWTKGKLWAPVARDDTVWCEIAKFYQFDPDCASNFQYYSALQQQTDEKEEESAHGLVPVYHLNSNGGPCRRIVLVTSAAARMLFGTRPYKGPGVEIVSVGVRAFEAYDGKFLADAPCRWRAVVEAASYLAPLMGARRMVLSAAHHPQLLKQLLSNGFVWLQDHWRVILGHASAAQDGVLPFLRHDGKLHTILTSTEWTEPPTHEVQSMLAESVMVGGVLLGLVGGKLAGEEGPWWLSATLSGSKLELAVDASLRTFGLLAFLGVDGTNVTSPADAASV
ncbi:methyltransferase [Trypanosoma grayi]|uniref:methyltransferase n=1 Tax=Trypanosoma grayi TaxID=71804 RepID=UPI0004F459BC|nr:methyltransferase [Trypanosoma grayi]KEG15154.1 methyltransferase [Trypanosoma grayi]